MNEEFEKPLPHSKVNNGKIRFVLTSSTSMEILWITNLKLCLRSPCKKLPKKYLVSFFFKPWILVMVGSRWIVRHLKCWWRSQIIFFQITFLRNFPLPRYFRKIQKQTKQPRFFKISIGNLAIISYDRNKSSWWWRSWGLFLFQSTL